MIISMPYYKRPVLISFSADQSNLNKTWPPPSLQKRKVLNESSYVIIAIATNSTNDQLTSTTWTEELQKLKKEIKSTMENFINKIMSKELQR